MSSYKIDTLDKLYTATSLKKWVEKSYAKQIKIGFVPTMGALHQGHISLIQQAKQENDVVICSIFVNPTQFNNPDDLVKYPRTLSHDLTLLEEVDCDAVFIPTIEEVYPDYPNQTQFIELSLSSLGDVMEGKYRSGHFAGVVNVVYRFFDLVKPHNAYFGLKDYQQVAVIKHLVNEMGLPVNIVACPTLREASGLAKSSRNTRLSEQQKNDAVVIYETLLLGKSKTHLMSPIALRNELAMNIENSVLKLEYIEIVNPDTLEPLTDKWVSGAVCCIAAYCGDVRLIDNMQFIA